MNESGEDTLIAARTELAPPTDSKNLNFDSYEEFLKTVTSADTSKNQEFLSENLNEIYGTAFCNFVQGLGKEDIKVIFPYFMGTQMELNGKIETQKIVMFTRELLDLPWVWYYCQSNEGPIVVGWTYPEIAFEGGGCECSFDEYARAFRQDFPTAANADLYTSAYSKICKETLNLKDSTVSATVYYFKSNNRVHYRFIMDNIMFSIWKYDGGELNADFWKDFSVVK